ncbi:MAG TPA: c-type cytochrome, partial [Verrucomicrobiota bacterium]|nr:c-type cytochrome [Verrucomicrobiota bacterium]
DPPVVQLPAVSPAEVTQLHETAADLAGRLRLIALAPPLRQVLDDPVSGLVDRTHAARALAALEPEPTAQRLTAILADSNQSVAERTELGLVLAEMNSDRARQSLVAAMKTVPSRTQVRWAAELAKRKDGAEALFEGVEQGLISARVLQSPDVKNRLQASLPTDGAARLTRLTSTLPPADETRDRLLLARRNGYTAVVAKPDEGQRIFEANCAVCHQLDGKGGLVGPQLTGIGIRGLERLCEDILDPNRNVDRAFRQTIVTLKDGEVTTGLLRREEGDLLVFADATGKEFTVKKSDVAERREGDQSLMPENFGEVLPEADFNQLMAFLLAQRGK